MNASFLRNIKSTVSVGPLSVGACLAITTQATAFVYWRVSCKLSVYALSGRAAGIAMAPDPIVVQMSKKSHERECLDRFLKGLPDQLASPSIQPYERPDFLLKTTESIIGIEITLMYLDAEDHGSMNKRQSILQERIVSAVNDLLGTSGLPISHLSLHFNPNIELDDSSVRKIASAFVNFLQSIASQLPPSFYLRSENFFGTSWPEAILFASGLLDRNSPPEAHFSGSLWVGKPAPEELQEVISNKNSIAESRDPKLSEYWLLVASDRFVQSGALELDAIAREVRYKSSFDRVFFMDHVDRVTRLELL